MVTVAASSVKRFKLARLFGSLARSRWSHAIILLLAFAAIILMAGYSYRAIDRELTDSALSRRASISYLAAAVLSEKFDRLADIGISLATRVRFRELVEAGNWTEAIKIVSSVPRDFPFIERLTLVDPHGTMMADVPELPGVKGQNFAHRDWYQGIKRNWEPYVSRVYKRAALPQLNIFVVVVPIKGSKGEVLGILLLQVLADTFFDWTKNIGVGPGGLVYVVDRHGTLAFHPKFPPQGDLIDYSGVPVVQRVLRGKRGVEIAVNPIEGEERVVAYEPMTKYGWGVVVLQPTATVFATRDHQLRRVLIAYGLILIFVAFAAYLASRIVVERGRSQEAVARSEALQRHQATVLQSILDSLGDGVTVTDKDLKVLLINPVAKRIIGLGPEDPLPADWSAVEGRYLPDMVTPFPTDRLFISRALRGENVDDEEAFIRNRRYPDGLWVSASARPIVSDGVVQQAVVVWRDITERRRANSRITALNRELEQRAAQLEAANKELESFSYSVSHDLRSPLRAIDGYSQILGEDYAEKLDEEGRRVLGVIRESTQKMGVLIDDLLAFSQFGRKVITAVEVDMNALVKEVLLELQTGGAAKPLPIAVSKLPTAWGDRALLKQVWVNLLSNAIKFAGTNDRPVIEIGATVDGTESVYSVKDNGVGFDMQYYGKLFGVFQRLHSSDEFSGTGVGLAIVQRVVSRHGGRVWAEGKLNGGATFCFALPRGA